MVISIFSTFFNCGARDKDINTEPTETTVAQSTVTYITDRSVQFEEENNEYVVFFGLQDEAQNYICASGVATIAITDDGDNLLYSQDLYFDESDFTEWTNQIWDSARYMCGLYISRDELSGSTSPTGTLSLAVTCDGYIYFSPDELFISDLPEKQVELILPELPVKITDKQYSYTHYCEVTDITYSNTISYDNTATLTVKFTVTLTSKTDRIDKGDYVHIGYKLVDSEGIVIDSGDTIITETEVGDTAKNTKIFFDLDPNETYTLKLTDVD